MNLVMWQREHRGKQKHSSRESIRTQRKAKTQI